MKTLGMKTARAVDRRPTTLAWLFALGVAVVALTTTALPAHAQTPQQAKMGECNHQAAGMKGDDRKAFMKDCLTKKTTPPPTRQDKMRSCNHDAVGKKGDDRKAFMKDCLSNH